MTYCDTGLTPINGGVLPAIDRSVLGEWLGDDDAGIDALLAVFRDSVCAEQTRLHETLALGDLDEFAKTAHRMRGAALSMGARDLATMTASLHTAALVHDSASCVVGMAALEIQVRLMVAEIPVDKVPPVQAS